MTIHEISKIIQRSIDGMSSEEKKSIREAIDLAERDRIEASDAVLMWSCGIKID